MVRDLTKQACKSAIALLVVLSCVSQGFAQNTANGGNGLGEQKAHVIGGPRKQLATIVFAGLGGAILGLSTLSFYGRPQENLRNIVIGAAFGIFVGTSYVTYKAALNPAELYGSRPQIEPELERTGAFALQSAPASPLQLNWSFDF